MNRQSLLHAALSAAAVLIAIANTEAATVTWSGNVAGVPEGTWAAGAPANWTGDDTVFRNGYDVVFDDSVFGATLVAVDNGNVFPASITLHNSFNDYTLSGGGIVGGGNFNKDGLGSLTFGNSGNSLGSFYVWTGTVNVNGGLSTSGKTIVTGGGTLNWSGNGSVQTAANEWFGIGDNAAGVLNVTGGSLTATPATNLATFIGNNSIGAVNVSGGTFTLGNSSPLWLGSIGAGLWGDGTLAVSDTGTVVATTPGNIVLGSGDAFTFGVIQLNGGVLETGRNIMKGPGTGIFNFNGGTLKAASDNATWMQGLTHAYVGDGGAVIDTNGKHVTIAQALEADGAGGLTKTGAGTLVLGGANNYTGGTTLSAGTLVATTPETLSGPVTLAGGTLALAGGAVGGFGGNGAGWAINSNGTAVSVPVSGDVLTLTANNTALGEVRTAFHGTSVPVDGSFEVKFTYQVSGGNWGLADGATFTLQADPRGPKAMGDGGGGLGYGGITPSVAVAFNIYPDAPGGVGTALDTNGVISAHTSVAPVNLRGAVGGAGNPIDVTLVYDAAAHTLTQTLAERNTANTWTTATPYNIDLQALLGGTAWVGFTGATGGAISTQTISNFTFGPLTPTTYGNEVQVEAESTSGINVLATAARPTIGLSMLAMGANATLKVAAQAGTPADQAFALTVSETTLQGDVTFDVGNNGRGAGTLALEALDDLGVSRAITKTGAGTLILSAGATPLSADTPLHVAAGTLATGGVQALGPAPRVVIDAGGVLRLGGDHTVPVLTNNGHVDLAASTLTLDSADATVSAGGFSGAGALVKQGDGTWTLANSGNSHTGGTTVVQGALVAPGPGALGWGPVTLGNATLSVGSASEASGLGGNGGGWKTNGNAAIQGDVLTLTRGIGYGEVGTAYFGEQVPVVLPFTVSFDYEAKGVIGLADGLAFVLHNDARGTSAVGDSGGALAYGSPGSPNCIQPSAAVELNVYAGAPGGRGTRYAINGDVAGLTGYNNVAPADITNGPIHVVLAYDGAGQLAQTLTDNSGNTYTATYAANLGVDAGGAFAWLGFTAATGGETAVQTVRNFTLSAVLPEYPNDVAIQAGANATIAVAATPVVPAITMGRLTLGAGSTLHVAADASTAAGLAYGLVLGDTLLTGNGTVDVAENGAAGTLTLGAIRDGDAAHGITKTGPGELVLADANDYDGGTTVFGGTLRVAHAGALPAGGALTIGSGAAVVLSAGLTGGAASAASAAAAVPEPSAAILLAAGAAALLAAVWRRRRLS